MGYLTPLTERPERPAGYQHKMLPGGWQAKQTGIGVEYIPPANYRSAAPSRTATPPRPAPTRTPAKVAPPRPATPPTTPLALPAGWYAYETLRDDATVMPDVKRAVRWAMTECARREKQATGEYPVIWHRWIRELRWAEIEQYTAKGLPAGAPAILKTPTPMLGCVDPGQPRTIHLNAGVRDPLQAIQTTAHEIRHLRHCAQPGQPTAWEEADADAYAAEIVAYAEDYPERWSY